MAFDPDKYLAEKQAFDPDAYLAKVVPEVTEAPEALGVLGTSALTAGQAATFDFLDELYGAGSAAKAALSGEVSNLEALKASYEKARDEARAVEEASRQANPVAAGVGTGVGLFAPALLTGGTSLVGTAGAKLGAKGLGKLAAMEAGEGLGAKVLSGAVSGLEQGVLNELGQSRSLSDVSATDLAAASGTGVAQGFGLGLVAHGVGKVVSSLMDTPIGRSTKTAKSLSKEAGEMAVGESFIEKNLNEMLEKDIPSLTGRLDEVFSDAVQKQRRILETSPEKLSTLEVTSLLKDSLSDIDKALIEKSITSSEANKLKSAISEKFIDLQKAAQTSKRNAIAEEAVLLEKEAASTDQQQSLANIIKAKKAEQSANLKKSVDDHELSAALRDMEAKKLELEAVKSEIKTTQLAQKTSKLPENTIKERQALEDFLDDTKLKLQDILAKNKESSLYKAKALRAFERGEPSELLNESTMRQVANARKLLSDMDAQLNAPKERLLELAAKKLELEEAVKPYSSTKSALREFETSLKKEQADELSELIASLRTPEPDLGVMASKAEAPQLEEVVSPMSLPVASNVRKYLGELGYDSSLLSGAKNIVKQTRSNLSETMKQKDIGLRGTDEVISGLKGTLETLKASNATLVPAVVEAVEGLEAGMQLSPKSINDIRDGLINIVTSAGPKNLKPKALMKDLQKQVDVINSSISAHNAAMLQAGTPEKQLKGFAEDFVPELERIATKYGYLHSVGGRTPVSPNIVVQAIGGLQMAPVYAGAAVGKLESAAAKKGAQISKAYTDYTPEAIQGMIQKLDAMGPAGKGFSGALREALSENKSAMSRKALLFALQQNPEFRKAIGNDNQE